MSTTKISEETWAAVAAHVSGRWARRRGARGTLLIKGRPIAARMVMLDPQLVAKPRLRFDRVALRLIESVKTAILPKLRTGSGMLITCTAPIRLPARVALDVESAAANVLLRRSGKDFSGKLSGNLVRIRLLPKLSGASTICTFIHNPETDSAGLLDVAQELLVNVVQSPTRSAAPGLLVLCAPGPAVDFDAYDTVYRALADSLPDQRILMVFRDGKVRALSPL